MRLGENDDGPLEALKVWVRRSNPLAGVGDSAAIETGRG